MIADLDVMLDVMSGISRAAGVLCHVTSHHITDSPQPQQSCNCYSLNDCMWHDLDTAIE